MLIQVVVLKREMSASITHANNNENYDYGRVEIYISGEWGAVIAHPCTRNNSQVVCKQLGYSAYGMYYAVQ